MTVSPQVLTDCRIYLAGTDLTGFSNKVDFSEEFEDLDKTTFGSGGAHERVGGLADVTATIEGLWQAGDTSMPDDALWGELSGYQTALTVVPTSGASGSLAYLSRMMVKAYKPGGDVGKLLAWTADLAGNWQAAQGKILHPQGTARTSSGSGTGYQLGALSATQAMYVCLHVFSVTADSGSPTLTVTVESDDNSGFTSAATQATFTAATARSGQTKKVSGAVTDNWWRVSWVVGGGATNPSFLFAVSAGIAAK